MLSTNAFRASIVNVNSISLSHLSVIGSLLLFIVLSIDPRSNFRDTISHCFVGTFITLILLETGRELQIALFGCDILAEIIRFSHRDDNTARLSEFLRKYLLRYSDLVSKLKCIKYATSGILWQDKLNDSSILNMDYTV